EIRGCMPPIVLTVARFGFLILLWIFVFTVVGVIRRDLFAGVRSNRLVAAPRGVGPSAGYTRPAKVKRGKAAHQLVGTAGARGGNQDSVYAGPRLLAVADGMGGMAAGDVASNIVIATIAPLDEDLPGNAMVDKLRGAVDTANQQIRDAVDVNPALEGMGTTLTALLFDGTKI